MRKEKQAPKTIYEKIGIIIGIFAGVCTILGISVFSVFNNTKNDKDDNQSIDFENNEINLGDQSPIIIGNENTFNYESSVLGEDIKKIAFVSKISIGCNKNWVDEKFGVPFSINTINVTNIGRVNYDKNGNIYDKHHKVIEEDAIINTYLECIYFLDDILVMTIYYDSSNNLCKAFFITLLNGASVIDNIIPEVYSSLVSGKTIGEFTFTDIERNPDYIFGYVGQGVGRAFYGEKFYFGSSGNYQDFYFAILDYGMLSPRADFYNFLSNAMFEFDIYLGVKDIPSSYLLSHQRSILHPNTYGISCLDDEITFDLLSSYQAFDSLPLRDNNSDID